MAVGVCVGIAGVVGHLASGLDWRAFWIGARLPFQVRSSARMTGLLASAQLMRAVAVVLLIAGVSMLAQAFVQGVWRFFTLLLQCCCSFVTVSGRIRPEAPLR
jgi:hypothetical protein